MKHLLPFFIVLILGLPAFAQNAKTDNPPAPSFKVSSLDDKVFDSTSLKGKVIVLNLWFVNCPHCIEEIKTLNEVVDNYQNNKDVVFIGLATNNKAELERFLKKYPFKYNVVANAGDFMLLGFGEKQKDGSYYLPFPTHVVIDRDGRVTVKTSGVKGIEDVKNELNRQLGR